jgi:hypothetical protein
MTMRNKHRKNKGFTDAEIMDDSFPNPYMSVKEHRKARHEYYRNKAKPEVTKRVFKRILDKLDNMIKGE